jgi:hypothetical protein
MLQFNQEQMQCLDKGARDRNSGELLVDIEAVWAASRTRWARRFVRTVDARQRRQFFQWFMRWCDEEGIVERGEVICGAVLLFAAGQLGWTPEAMREAVGLIGAQYGAKEAALRWLEQEVDAAARREAGSPA